MNVKDSISVTMESIKGKEKEDKSAKNIFTYKPIMGNILKYTVAEYKGCTLEKIMDCIEGDTIQTGTALVEEDMAKTIRGEITELHDTDEAPAVFDILFRTLNPKSKGKIFINLHVDFEIQKHYSLGYPVIKRGVYYGCRKLSAQLDKIGKNGKGYMLLEKVYSIWICLDGIPKDLQNTISYYKIQNYKNEGFMEPNIKIDADEADLLEIVIVRLGDKEQDKKGVTDFLKGVFSGNKKKVLSYIPDSEDKNYQREVSDMLSMISYAEENGEKKGERKGEAKLGKLIKALLKDKRYSDIEKVTEDEEYREKMYKEFGM